MYAKVSNKTFQHSDAIALVSTVVSRPQLPPRYYTAQAFHSRVLGLVSLPPLDFHGAQDKVIHLYTQPPGGSLDAHLRLDHLSRLLASVQQLEAGDSNEQHPTERTLDISQREPLLVSVPVLMGVIVE